MTQHLELLSDGASPKSAATATGHQHQGTVPVHRTVEWTLVKSCKPSPFIQTSAEKPKMPGVRMEITIAASFDYTNVTGHPDHIAALATTEAQQNPEAWFKRLLQWAKDEPSAHGILYIHSRPEK